MGTEVNFASAGFVVSVTHRFARVIPAVWWLAFSTEQTENDGTGRLLPAVDALRQLSAELDARVAAAGIGGMDTVLDVQRRMHGVLDGVSGADIDQAWATVRALERELCDLRSGLNALLRLKALFGV